MINDWRLNEKSARAVGIETIEIETVGIEIEKAQAAGLRLPVITLILAPGST